MRPYRLKRLLLSARENGVFFCTYKNSSSSFGISLFFSSTTHNVALQKKKHVLLGSTGHDACDSRIRGEAEANGRAVSARHPVRPLEGKRSHE